MQNSLSNYIKINFKQNVDEYLNEKLKWHIIEKNDYLKKVKRYTLNMSCYLFHLSMLYLLIFNNEYLKRFNYNNNN